MVSRAPEAPVAVTSDLMKAAVFRGVNDLRLESVPVPKAGPGEAIVRRIRACAPYPGARTTYRGTDVKVFAAKLIPVSPATSHIAGEIIEATNTELLVQAGDHAVVSLEEVQFPGKKRVPIRDALHGHQFVRGTSFENESAVEGVTSSNETENNTRD